MRTKIKQENQHYIDQHPELRVILDEFMSSAILEKPTDIVGWGFNFFNKLKIDMKMRHIPPIVLVGPSGVGKRTLIHSLVAKYPNIFISPLKNPPPLTSETGQYNNQINNTSNTPEMSISNGLIEVFDDTDDVYDSSTEIIEKVSRVGMLEVLFIEITIEHFILSHPLIMIIIYGIILSFRFNVKRKYVSLVCLSNVQKQQNLVILY